MGLAVTQLRALRKMRGSGVEDVRKRQGVRMGETCGSRKGSPFTSMAPVRATAGSEADD